MDALRTAAPLARVLFALSEARREGELEVTQCARTATLAIADGRLYALRGVDVPPLGDALRALGTLDPARMPGDDGRPIGARLVEAGATSRAAVIDALALQLMQGVDALLRWPSTRLSFHARPIAARGAKLDLSAALWSALLARAHALPAAQLAQLAGDESLALALTLAGDRRVRGLHHAQASGALARSCIGSMREAHGLCPASLTRALAARHEPCDRPLRAVLRVLGLAAARPEPDDAYALLLRKARELARNESAATLLDLPRASDPKHARQALRRLAQKLHPDRFQASDRRLHALSQRVMGALAHAESSLRA